MKKLVIAAALACVTVAGAFAEKAQPGLYVDQNAQASYNPLGFQLVTKFFYRVPLIDKEGILWESTRIDAGILNNLSPAYDMAGVFLTIEPIAIFNITLTAQAAGYYSALGFGFLDLAGPASGFDSPSLQALSPKNASGYVLSAAPTLKVAVGPIALLNTFSAMYFNVDGGNGYFFERINNCVLGKSDTELINQAYFMYTILPGLLAGVNDWLLYIPSSGYISHRVAALGVYSTKVGPRLSLYSALSLGTFLADRYFQYNLYAGGQVGVILVLC